MAAIIRPSNPSPAAALFHNELVDQAFDDHFSFVIDEDFTTDYDPSEDDCDLAVFMAPVSESSSSSSRCVDYSPSWLPKRPRCPTPSRSSFVPRMESSRCRNPTPLTAGRVKRSVMKPVTAMKKSTARAISSISSSGCSSLANSPLKSPMRSVHKIMSISNRFLVISA